MNVAKTENTPHANPEHVVTLSRAVASWYVRKDNKFYPFDRLTTKLSKEDVERARLFQQCFRSQSAKSICGLGARARNQTTINMA